MAFATDAFSLFPQKKVLELCCGAGYDAYLCCRNGADYTGIGITLERVRRVENYLGLYGYDLKRLREMQRVFRLRMKPLIWHISMAFCIIHRILRKPSVNPIAL